MDVHIGLMAAVYISDVQPAQERRDGCKQEKYERLRAGQKIERLAGDQQPLPPKAGRHDIVDDDGYRHKY